MKTLSRQAIQSCTLPAYYEEGKRWFETGRVEHWTLEGNRFEGRLSIGHRSQICRFTLDEKGHPQNDCPCRVSRDEGMICGHVVAILLAWHAENADPHAEREDRVHKRFAIPAERRRGTVRTGATGVSAAFRITLRRTWPQEVLAGKIHIIPAFEFNGRTQRPDTLHISQVLNLPPEDEKLLLLLEDIHGGPLPPVFPVSIPDFVHILTWRAPAAVHVLDWLLPIQLNAGKVLSILTVDLDAHSGELILTLTLDLPKSAPAGTSPITVLSHAAGWVLSGDNAWPLAAVPPPELQGLCNGPVRVPRERVLPFSTRTSPDWRKPCSSTTGSMHPNSPKAGFRLPFISNLKAAANTPPASSTPSTAKSAPSPEVPTPEKSSASPTPPTPSPTAAAIPKPSNTPLIC